MRSSAYVHSALGPDGRSRLVRLSGSPPLVPRQTGTSTVHLVAAAGGPLPGDVSRLDLTVGPGALLTVLHAGATVALPGPDPHRPASRQRVCATVAPGGTLVVLGQPVVAARGCRHHLAVEIGLGAGARLVWRDLVVPGRTDEPAGRLDARLRVTREGLPVLDSALAVGPGADGWSGPAVLAGARSIGSLLVVGTDPPGAGLRAEGSRTYGPDAALMALAAPGADLGTALGDPHAVLQVLADMAHDALGGDLRRLVREHW